MQKDAQPNESNADLLQKLLESPAPGATVLS